MHYSIMYVRNECKARIQTAIEYYMYSMLQPPYLRVFLCLKTSQPPPPRTIRIYCTSLLPFSLQLYAKLRVDVRFCACEHYYTACATLIPSITLQPSIGASATLLVSGVLQFM